MFRFLHLADVHLDTAFSCRSESLRSHLRQSLRHAFGEAVQFAVRERLDAVLIAGDLFDNDRLGFATERFLVDRLRELHEAGITCIYVTGNHDPGGRSYRASGIQWPESFRYISDRIPRAVDVRSRSGEVVGRVVGAGHVSAREAESLVTDFPPAAGDIPTVGLLHAMLVSAAGAELHDRYAPCTEADLASLNYDYWALGHIHLRQQVDAAGRISYAGNIQGRNPRETGAKGGLLVSIDRTGIPRVEFQPFSRTRWETLTLSDLSDVTTFEQLTRNARQAFDRQVADQESECDWLLRVTLSGPTPLARDLKHPEHLAELENELRDVLDALDVEIQDANVTEPVDVARYTGETHVLGEVLGQIARLRSEPAVPDEIGLPDLQGVADGADPHEYMLSLLEGLEGDAANRMLEKDARN